MGSSGPMSINLVAVAYALDNFYEEVDNKRYFIEKFKHFISVLLAKLQETSKHGKARS